MQPQPVIQNPGSNFIQDTIVEESETIDDEDDTLVDDEDDSIGEEEEDNNDETDESDDSDFEEDEGEDPEYNTTSFTASGGTRRTSDSSGFSSSGTGR